MIAVSVPEVIELKNEVNERFSAPVHFHDRCGGQFFSLEKADDELQEFIKAYFSLRNIKAVFSEDGMQFTLQEPEQ